MEKNNWLGELAAQVLQIKEDMEEIALSGQYPVVVLLRSYELLEKLGSWEEMEYNMQQYGKGESAKFYEALELYCNSYLANGERLYAIMDMEQIRMKAAAYMGPWKRKHNIFLKDITFSGQGISCTATKMLQCMRHKLPLQRQASAV